MHRQDLFVNLLDDTLEKEAVIKLYNRLDNLPDKVLVLLIDELLVEEA